MTNLPKTVKTIGEDVRSLTQEIGLAVGGGLMSPVGTIIDALDNASPFSQGLSEYLETGDLKRYSSDYKESILISPKIATYGSSEKALGAVTGTDIRLKKISYGVVTEGKPPLYVSMLSNNSSISYSTDLKTWKSLAVSGGTSTRAIGGSDGLVMTSAGSSGRLRRVDFDGTTLSINPVDFGPQSGVMFKTGASRIVSLNNKLIACSDLNAITDGLWVLDNGADPANIYAWQSKSASRGITDCTEIAYGNGRYVFVGKTLYTTAGVASCSENFNDWRNSNPIGSSAVEFDIVFTGEYFILLANGSLFRSINGYEWEAVATALSCIYSISYNRPGSNNNNNFVMGDLFTDGKGLVGYVLRNQSSGMIRSSIRYSTQHGEPGTWKVSQIYPTTNVNSVSGYSVYVNNKLLVSNGAAGPILDLGENPFKSDPDYVGIPVMLASGAFVRIK